MSHGENRVTQKYTTRKHEIARPLDSNTPISTYRVGAFNIAVMKYTLIQLAVPLQAWSGPEGSRNLRFPHFMTMAQDGGKVVSLTHLPPLLPGNTAGTHFC